MAAYPQHLNLSIRLQTGGRSNEDITPGIALVRHWQQYIHEKSDVSERTEQLIRDWYKLKDLEEFSRQYPVDMDKRNNGGNEQLEDRHAQWMEREEITATPTFFINGYQLPRQYGIGDLRAMIPALADRVEKKQVVPNK